MEQNVDAGAADATQSWSKPHVLPPLDDDEVLDDEVDVELLVPPLELEPEDADEVEPLDELEVDDVSSLLHAARLARTKASEATWRVILPLCGHSAALVRSGL